MTDKTAIGRQRMRRRDLLALIGVASGAATMFQSMTALGFVAESPYKGPIRLDGDPKGASVLILGAGLAGMVAAYELRKAGYKLQVLEYNDRVGGRSWTIRGGDAYTELGGFTQKCAFDPGLYFNPGPWRIPYHHRAILDYCKRLGVALEPFVQVNHNAYVHSENALDGRPQRLRFVQADFNGAIAELLAKAANKGALDELVTKEDQERLLDSLRRWGALDRNYAYVKGALSSNRRGFNKDPGGGFSGGPEFSQPLVLSDILKLGFWSEFGSRGEYNAQTTMFQPVAGMDAIARALQSEVGTLIRFNSKVTAIRQDQNGVTVAFVDLKRPDRVQTARADWCLCTIPLSILSQVEMNVGAAMQAAIGAVPYAASCKVGLQFKRRFWEEDEAIYGGITYTDLPIGEISYPSTGYHAQKGVLLGAYSPKFAAFTPEESVKRALEYGARIHPQYPAEFETGISVAWPRVPSASGCFSVWSDETRAQHYKNLCAIEGRILLAGEHASYLNAWQEGAVLSAIEAITRLHQRIVAG